jgi:hypothetical protein
MIKKDKLNSLFNNKKTFEEYCKKYDHITYFGILFLILGVVSEQLDKDYPHIKLINDDLIKFKKMNVGKNMQDDINTKNPKSKLILINCN